MCGYAWIAERGPAGRGGSAAAVAAVRERWRVAFRPASRPGTPAGRASTAAPLTAAGTNSVASSSTQIGIVNSIATTCAIGIIVRARNQANWAP